MGKPSNRSAGRAQHGGDRLTWWREGRFGLFIHWGLYAIPAGRWKGKAIKGIGEQIMRQAQIPVTEYRKLTERFNPTEFDAAAWVRLAKQAGMRYIVFTAKHHDGFAMYHSRCSEYNIVDATPYGQDVVKELARECRKAGLRFCVYYSHARDWDDPDSVSDYGNTWDYPDGDDATAAGSGEGSVGGRLKDPERYLRGKAEPQLRELLSDYGRIGLIWFDTPVGMTRRQCVRMKRLVRELQPDCLCSGRLGHDLGDYQSLGDNQIPPGPIVGDWEVPVTMNDTWGYKTDDRNWKSPETLLYLLVDLASKGISYLLNVGPTARGTLPRPSIQRLEYIGKWMAKNSDAIYGTEAGPFSYEFPWGRITQKGSKLYLIFFAWPKAGEFVLYGLCSRVRRAFLLADRRMKVGVTQRHDADRDHDTLKLALPKGKPTGPAPVVVLQLAEAVRVDPAVLQQPDGSIRAPASMARLHLPKRGRQMQVLSGGTTANWFNKQNWLEWPLKVSHPGAFTVKVVTASNEKRVYAQEGHRLSLAIGGQTLRATVREQQRITTAAARYFPQWATRFGRIQIDKPGLYTMRLRAEEIRKDLPDGLIVAEVLLCR